MFITVSNKCIGCGICSLLSPEVFEIYNGYAVPELEKIFGQEENCLKAQKYCPVNAITIDLV